GAPTHSDTAQVRFFVDKAWGNRCPDPAIVPPGFRIPPRPLFSNSPRCTGINPASEQGMMIVLGIAGLTFALALLLITELRKAPEGFEDHTGFHAVQGTDAPGGN